MFGIPNPTAKAAVVQAAPAHGPIAVVGVGDLVDARAGGIVQIDRIARVAEDGSVVGEQPTIHVGHRESEPTANGIDDARVPRRKTGQIRRNHQVIARADNRVRRKCVGDAAADAPVSEIDVGRPRVEQLDELLPHVVGRRVIHDLVDDDVLRRGARERNEK